MNSKVPLTWVCGAMLTLGLTACGKAAEPSAAGATSAPPASASTASGGSRKADCDAFNKLYDTWIDERTEAIELIHRKGPAEQKEKGLKDLAASFQHWENGLTALAASATDPTVKASAQEYLPLLHKQVEQLAALKDPSDFTTITLAPKANEVQLKLAEFCG